MQEIDPIRHINRDRLTETFIELIKVNSPSFQEAGIGRVLSNMLEKAGCETVFQKYDGSFNLIGFKKGTDKKASPLLLSGHMDTIEPTAGIAFSIGASDNGNAMIKSTGETVLGADDKSALAQIIEALTVLQERDIPHGDIEVVFTSVEEKGLLGAKNLDYTLLKSRHALVLDSSGPVGSLVIAAPSHVTYEMRITGRSAHAGIEPEKGINAVRVAAEIISSVPDGRIDHETTANIGIIYGGTATNVVPKEVIVNGELRSHSKATLEATREKIFGTARRTAEEHGAAVTIEDELEYSSYRINGDRPFVSFMEGVFRACGIEPVQVVTGGGADANIFNQRGLETINISTGMQKVHSTEEFIYLEDLYKGCAVVLKTVCEFGKFVQPI